MPQLRTLEPGGQEWIVYQPREVLRLLGGRHARDLTDYQQRLIAAICVGWTPQDIAAASGRSPKSVYRHIRELACHVLDPVGFEPTRDFLRTWAELHATCCCAPAFHLISKNRVL
jgi:hypothetical protein